MAPPHEGIPAGNSSQGTAVRAAQHLPAPQQGCEAKHFTPNPGERRLPGCLPGRMPALAILTVCLNDLGSFLSFPFPRNDGAIFYSLSHWV